MRHVYVLGVMGSPRKGGNSDLLLSRALEGAAGQGARTEKVCLADMDLRPCLACEGCRAGGNCVQKDDMQELYPRLQAAAGLVIATPVYWWGPSAQTKVFLDRWYALIPVREAMEGKRVAVLCAHADDDPGTARHLLGMFEESFRFLKMRLVGTLAVAADKRGGVAANRGALARAEELGRLAACACA
ncbi:MAG: NAD(P)H-dependent oxidoreductase [Bacillota bacterium]|nr:NAD(P)H-dependent oxidoreductase [Bacillota bacterium]